MIRMDIITHHPYIFIYISKRPRATGSDTRKGKQQGATHVEQPRMPN